MKINDTVRIKSENVTGIIVDISKRNGKVYYTVESSVKGAIEGKDGGEWPLYDCEKGNIEVLT